MPLRADDWRRSLVPGQKIRYLKDAVTYKSGTIRWVEYLDDDITVEIEFTNGDDRQLLMVNIKALSTD